MVELDNLKLEEDELELRKEILKQSKSFFVLGTLAFSVIYISILVYIFRFKQFQFIPQLLSIVLIFGSMFFMRIHIKKTEYEIKVLERNIQEHKYEK